jgi:hypothetical protein
MTVMRCPLFPFSHQKQTIRNPPRSDIRVCLSVYPAYGFHH